MGVLKVNTVKRLDNTFNDIPATYLVHNTKLWCAFNASTGTPAISNSYSVGSIVDVAVGRYIVRPDAFTFANTSSIMLGHITYARDNNLTAANTGFCGFAGGNAEARVGTWHPPSGAFIDPLYVSVIGAYERIIK